VNLQRRATTELTTQALLQAQGIAAQIGRDNIDDPGRLEQISPFVRPPRPVGWEP
jgi:hypothetical protein